MALFAAIVVGVIVIGLVAALSSFIMGQVDENRSAEQRTKATYWTQAAGEQLSSDLEAYRIGPAQRVGVAPGGTHELWAVPRTAAFGWDASRNAWKVRTSSTATSGRVGYFQLAAPVPGAAAGTVAFSLEESDPDKRGTITAVVRAWGEGTNARRFDTKLTIRRSNLSRFALLADNTLDLAALGTTTLRGDVHANNSEGVGTAVRLTGTSAAAVTSLTSASGAISGPCPAGRCRAETQQLVPFATADRSFNLVQQLGRTSCATATVLCWYNAPMNWAPAQHVPAWRVNLGGSGCIAISRISLPLRRDAGTVPSVDDTRAPVNAGGATSFCPALGGGAILFDGDVEVRGTRAANAAPVTILARRGGNPPTVTVNGTAVRLTTPASAWLVGSLGSASASVPVGIVAEGSAFIPSWAYASGLENDAQLNNVALMTKIGRLGLGPATAAIAGATDSPSGSGGNVMAGGGLDPCAARAAGYGSGTRLTFRGSLASRAQPVLQYGSAACWIGHGQRRYEPVERLAWNPPPAYPSDDPWHVSEWTDGG